jgi:predicted alpha/beta-fold hydrolase
MPHASPSSEPSRFRPLPGTSGGHIQTFLGYWCRQHLRWRLPAEDLIVSSAPGVQLLCRATWQPGPRRERPALVIAHGLGGSSEASYEVSLGRAAHDAGWHVVRMNLRGAGPSEAICARLYNAGLAEDVVAVARAVAHQAARVVLVGYSLGGNLVLLAGSRDAGGLPDEVAGLAAVCAPVELAACANRFDAPANAGYRAYFLAALRDQYRRRQRRLPELYAPGLERGLRSIWEYDEVVTARYGGFADARDYYARSSSGPWLARLARPALLLWAADDPLVPIGAVERWPVTPGAVREVAPTGGHVGFVGRSRAPGLFWAADRVLEWASGLTGG